MKGCLQIVTFCLLLALSGCAIQGKNTMQYTPPTFTQVKNEMLVSQPYTVVWDKLVKGLSKSFFVINNIDRESRIINLSFSTDNPRDYINCGRNLRTYTQGSKVETYDYEVAGTTTFKVATERQPHPAFAYYYLVTRQTSLEGRSNIYVAPDENDNNKTLVTVNTRYVFTARIKQVAFQENVGGQIMDSTFIPEDTTTVIFNTNKVGELANAGGPGNNLMCCATGLLEEEILALIEQ